MKDVHENPLVELYRKRAANYDFTANLYYLIGYREWAYRKEAIKTLALQKGDTVVEIGCGTGLNFRLLQEAVGSEGRIIGVDLTDAMLEMARARVAKNAWTNVELVHCDAAKFAFPDRTNGAFSSYALTLSPDLENVIKRGAAALSPGGRWVILDFQWPDRLPSLLKQFSVLITSPFGVTRELEVKRPWDTVRTAMSTSLDNLTWRELYMGITYIAAGEKRVAPEES